MRLLIVYGSTEGQTKKICKYIRDKAEQDGHQVSIVDASGPEVIPTDFDAVIIGASLHVEKYQSSITHYVREYHQILNRKTTGFLSVSLAVVDKNSKYKKELDAITQKFLDDTGWNPTFVEQVAGALSYTKYNLIKKFIMRMIAKKSGGSTDTSRDTEYTDWNQIKWFLGQIENQVRSKSQKNQLNN